MISFLVSIHLDAIEVELKKNPPESRVLFLSPFPPPRVLFSFSLKKGLPGVFERKKKIEKKRKNETAFKGVVSGFFKREKKKRSE